MAHRPTHTQVLTRRAAAVRLRAAGASWTDIVGALHYPSIGAAWSDFQRATAVDVLAELEAAQAAAEITDLMSGTEIR